MSDDEQIRRLLADARHDEPMPDDVVARLDGVLADLRDEKRPAAPVDLAARRRRRHVRNGLLAAAAVVVVGIGLNQVDLSATGDADAGGDAAAGSQESGAREVERPHAAAPDADAGSATDWARAELDLSSDGFGDQVSEFRQQKAARIERYTSDGALSELASGATGSFALCQMGRLGPGHRVPVRYDGEPGWLVFRPARGETQVVDLYLCGADAPARSITLPAP